MYDVLTQHKDYAGACTRLAERVQHYLPDARTLLDVACGTGMHLSHLRHQFDVEGLDASAEMLAVARTRCPGVPLHQSSFSEFDLGKRFDVVTCLFGSIAYAGDAATLRRSVACLARHLRSDGMLVLEPYVAPDRFITGVLVFDRADGGDLKVARMYVTERRGDVAILDSTYLVGEPTGITCFQEKQELGLFTADDYRGAFHDAGLALLDATGTLFGYGLYMCRATRSPNG